MAGIVGDCHSNFHQLQAEIAHPLPDWISKDFHHSDPAFLEDACKGDSGGPAVFFDEFKNHFAIVGVTIAGSRTCSTTRGTIKAGVYSNVLYYEDWIDEATNFGCA